MKINCRLNAVINEINGHTMVDIGCDHGKVSIKALLDNKVEKVIACDISDKSLDKTRELAKYFNIDKNKIDFRCGDGFNVLKEKEADVAVIAGMGGREIASILESILDSIEKLVLCPHTDVQIVRKKLVSIGYKIIKDYIVQDSTFFYSIIVAIKGKDKLNEKELLLGRDNINNSSYNNYLYFLLDKYKEILSKDIGVDKIEKYTKYINIVKRELNEG